ncbi:MAG TPA: HD-GYP domain-containing protein [Gaiellaceae bacterium]|nr:HD-GYP domain-containing protein [Gaiellaceae bacterium]
MSAETFDPVLERQLADARARQGRGLAGREALGRWSLALVVIGGASALLSLAGTHRQPSEWLYPAFVVAYAVVCSLKIEVGSGLALPTELVLVPMLFLLPARAVPMVVVGGMLLAQLPDVARGALAPERAVVRLGSAFFAFGPALVFLAYHEPTATWHGGAVLAGALAAQLLFDYTGSATLERIALRVSPRELVKPLLWAFAFDVLVAPLAFGMVIANRAQPGALLLPLPLIALLYVFVRERRQRLDSLLELSGAYRGTAFLLGDVVEADDAYTGDHSRQVVELVTEVCDRLGLAPRERRIAEFTALLHDVGKIRIPAEIINKPGPLTPKERALINTHTITGEELLVQVGGLLADVGHIVRSCHERWDGQGYPDGLKGNDIPLVARIVCCCDAFNAMTTDRSYRRALTTQAAIEELRANRGTQFDPAVVDALVARLALGTPDSETDGTLLEAGTEGGCVEANRCHVSASVSQRQATTP